MQVTRREGALAEAIHAGSFASRRGREEHQGSFVLLPYQGSHAQTNIYKHLFSPPMQPARLSLSKDRGWHLSRSWLTNYNLLVFSLDGVILADLQMPSHRCLAPSRTRKAAGWRQGRPPF
uniref:Uncharacterized protein n=1 Tax=Aegilops tauschii subsp. strangulata TaxID=200361 RepID=A0A453DPD0_AEGTS